MHNATQDEIGMELVLHGLCQPLTVLQCRLALGELAEEPFAMREAIHEALRECQRLNQSVGAMRAIVRHGTFIYDRSKRGE